MMNSVMVPKNTPMSLGHHLFKHSGLGKRQAYDRHHESDGRAEATPFWTKTSITGKMPAALEYMGTARTTANGTSHQWPPDR